MPQDESRTGEASEGGRIETVSLGDAARIRPDQRLGHYKILEQIGEGGFAIVYLAEQEKPVRRRVALKIIKLGMDTKQVIARFEAERQALAIMDHPNVAKVFDAGATDTGRPYFVMEHVPGVSITEHCDRQRLNIEERLKLFMQVCDAVQHAHQKGIIHRDIKPSNVLVLFKDGKAVPKVIDFGVAKALHHRLTEKTIFTEQGQLIGTPEYMSPEQAEMTAQDIDTRSDIYSLGVLLYELLTGALPFDPTTLRNAAFGEIQRIIREQEPPRPSTRLSSLGDESMTSAKQRSADPKSLLRELRGDLDWIVMKAMEKDRGRRYETTNGLAMDIRRHLDHEPVLAGPPGAAYKLRKFVRRNRVAVAAGFVVAVGLSAATAVSVRFALSEAQQREIARAEATRADAEKEIAQAVNDFLNKDLLAAVAPSAAAGRGKDVLMRDVLDEAAKRIEKASAAGGRFEDKPLIEASIRATLGETYDALGEYAVAESHLERALQLRRRVLGEEDWSTVRSMSILAGEYLSQGRYDEAEPLRVKTLEVSKRVLGEEHYDTVNYMGRLALLYDVQGRDDEAESLYLKTLEIQKRVIGEKHPATLSSMHNLASLYQGQGRYDEAEPLYLKTLEIQKRIMGEEDPGTLLSMWGLADLYESQGRHDDAEQLYLKTLEIQKRIMGEEHHDTLGSMNNLALLYKRQGRYGKAEALFVKTLGLMRRVLGEEAPFTLICMRGLADLYENQGRHGEAESLYLETIEIKKRVLGEGHPKTLGSMNNLADLYENQGRHGEAESLYLETIEIKKRVLGKEDPSTLESMNRLSLVYLSLGRYDEAEPLMVKTLEIEKRALGEDDPETQGSMNNLALLYNDQGRYDQAEPLMVKNLEIQRRVLGEEHRYTLAAMTNLGLLYIKTGHMDEAERLLKQSSTIKQRVLGIRDQFTRIAMTGLADVYEQQGRLVDALPLRRTVLEYQLPQARRPEATSSELNEAAWTLLTTTLEALRDPTAALPLAREAVKKSGGENPGILDTLALAYFMTGEVAKAIETEEKALSLLPPDGPGRGEYEAAIAKYRAALKDESR